MLDAMTPSSTFNGVGSCCLVFTVPDVFRVARPIPKSIRMTLQIGAKPGTNQVLIFNVAVTCHCHLNDRGEPWLYPSYVWNIEGYNRVELIEHH